MKPDTADRFKEAADRVISRFKNKVATKPVCRRIEMLLRREIDRNFPELEGFSPTCIFRDGRPLVFIVANPANTN